MSGRVLVEKEGSLGFLIFDHPGRRNAVSVAMWRAIPNAISELTRDDDVRVVILRGSGDAAFVSGADISEFEISRAGQSASEYDAATVVAFDALAACPKPVIAMIHGFCVGGGVALALTADIRYAADDALFAIPAARLGLGYPVAGVRTLVDVLGPSSAKEVFFTGRRFSAPEALARGIVSDVRPKAELEAFVRKTADSIADNAPLTLRSFKLVVRELSKPSMPDEVAMAASIDACYASDDYGEGVRAFLEKRRPVFRGK